MRRQIASLPTAILLWTAATPFTPVAWLIGPLEGAFLVDRFVAGIILLSALYFQWKVAGLSHPIAIALPNPLAQGSDSYISNGRVGGAQARQEANKNADIVFFYHPSSYYVYLTSEIALLALAEFGGMEYLRRGIVLAVVAALWAVGWMVTPRRTKMWAWEHVKAFLFFVVLDLIRDVGFGGGRRRRRR
ncbi:hypothetical protein K469DRAFT_710960 [Zopfia rhizophila CBS 207.26]|uniref:Uncharacterized protein n=1 Tax=Zopfia rhizophila CBS 207.26 TaxID=1314779 RepID=A0A6A6DW54_9PEZI|nr:hypothetical protein K469DRAFT_710960 [Zopfia rhizophila CBS 207.26]